VLFTTSKKKVENGLRLGAHEAVISSDAAAMAKHEGSFDFILDCVSAEHDMNALVGLLKLDGTLTLVGASEKPLSIGAFGLLGGRKRLAGSGIGGIAETSISAPTKKIGVGHRADRRRPDQRSFRAHAVR